MRDPLPMHYAPSEGNCALLSGEAEEARAVLDRIRPCCSENEHVLSRAWLSQAAARIGLAAGDADTAIANARATGPVHA